MFYKELMFKRVALYIRVSKDEQALHGYSLPAQQSDLMKFAKEHQMQIVDLYSDEGITARKKMQNRKDFQRMINDVQLGKIDVIIFIRLDRWFRNVADYYKIQEILDANGVQWVTTQEQYDTATANGRLNVNIKLSIAQDEADRTSERIKFVFDNKINNGQVITGSTPKGLVIDDNKHIDFDPVMSPIVKDAFNYYELHRSQRKTVSYIRETYNLNWSDAAFRRMLTNPLYKGSYRDNENFCDPLILPSQFERIQTILNSHSVKHNPTGRCYIFTGILKCDTCGHNLGGYRTHTSYCDYFYYRCSQHFKRSLCTKSKSIREDMIEKYLLDNLEAEIEKYIVEYEVKQAQAPKKIATDTANIKKKLLRLKDLYINELITITEYKKDYDMYMDMLSNIPAAEPQTVDIKRLKDFMDSGFKNIYDRLEREEKRTLWGSVIKEIRVNDDNDITGIVFY